MGYSIGWGEACQDKFSDDQHGLMEHSFTTNEVDAAATNLIRDQSLAVTNVSEQCFWWETARVQNKCFGTSKDDVGEVCEGKTEKKLKEKIEFRQD